MTAAVLLVEDDALIASSLARALRSNGYDASSLPARWPTASRRSTRRSPTSCCSTSACPTATARRSAGTLARRPPRRAGDRADRPQRGGRRRARPRDGRRRLRRQAVPPRRAARPHRLPTCASSRQARRVGAGAGAIAAVVGDLTDRPGRPPGPRRRPRARRCGPRSSTCSSGLPATPAPSSPASS